MGAWAVEEELSDHQWGMIRPLLPAHKGIWRPRADDRRTLNGIPSASSGQALWVLHSGARWKDLPRRYGSRSTCHRRLQEWQELGVWEHIWLRFLIILDQQGKVDWSQAFLDGSLVPAKKGERTSATVGKARAVPST
jgi:transposase